MKNLQRTLIIIIQSHTPSMMQPIDWSGLTKMTLPLTIGSTNTTRWRGETIVLVALYYLKHPANDIG